MTKLQYSFEGNSRGDSNSAMGGAVAYETRYELGQGEADSLDTADDGDDDEPLVPPRVRRSDIIYVTTQLAVMVDTGISLATALEGIIEQTDNRTLRKVLTNIKGAVESGEDFSRALDRHPKYFSKTYVALVRASEATGTMGEMLDRIALYLRKELETRQKIRSALAYPTVMIVLTFAVTIFLLTFVMPKFAPIFERKKETLPRTTRVMMEVSDTMVKHWALCLTGFAAVVGGTVAGMRTRTGRRSRDWMKINLPVVGPMFRKVTISRSISTLGTMVSSGVSVLDALQLSSEVAGNVYYEAVWQKALHKVTSGSQIHEALAGNPLFPPMLVQMIRSGEETGKLGSVLSRVSAYYDSEVDSSVKTTTSLIEPIMIAVMGSVVGGIAMSIMLPIFSLSRMHG